jgi:hypothetical protein
MGPTNADDPREVGFPGPNELIPRKTGGDDQAFPTENTKVMLFATEPRG